MRRPPDPSLAHGRGRGRDERGRLVTVAALLAALVAAPACGDGSGGGEEAVTFFSGPVPRAMAHRGGADLFPENTIFAYEQALALGVQVLEIDVHRTLDGELVVLHDALVDRTTEARGEVKGLTLGQVKSLDAAHDFTTDGGATFPHRGRGITIPTLAEVFERFPDTAINIEIKQNNPAIEEDVLAVIEAHGMREKVCVGTFLDSVMNRWRALDDEICTSGSILDIVRFTLTPVETLAAEGFAPRALQIPDEELGVQVTRPGVIDKAHALGVEVHVWTVNDRQRMDELLAMGVDGIITNRPDRLVEAVDAFHAAGG